MFKKIIYIFGAVFVLIGILGFIPAMTPNGMLLGFFHVNVIHNLIHLITGLIAIAIGYCDCTRCTPRRFFQVFGIVYGLVAILGLFYGNADIFGLIANNVADVVLHFAIAAGSLWLGFWYQE